MDDLSDPDRSTRRGLLRAFARTAARQAREGAEAAGPGGFGGLLAAGEPPPDPPRDPPTPAAPARVPARAPARAASVDELLELAHAEGLTGRDDELRVLARPSLRMTRTEAADADAWILTGDGWDAEGEELLVAVIRLGALGDHDHGLPNNGWLALFVGTGAGSTQSEARPAHGVLLDMPAAIPNAAEPAALHPELVLPRRWHELVQTLDLRDPEGDAYDRLRAQLQAFQSVESDADGGVGIGYHRLLGYPNETTGNMPFECVRGRHDSALADRDESAGDDSVLHSRQWQLLAQISFGDDRRRAYVWIHATDLGAHEFGRLCAFIR